jgi:hypothetical protein
MDWQLMAPIIRGSITNPLTDFQMECFKSASLLRVRRSLLQIAGEGCDLRCEGELSYLVPVSFALMAS